ncbi:uncharacterized protein AMSG_00503 [Thecamonas trahens ATCC 50062]|uniref:MICOS complex subunit MIC60 n=1 Tax=Thecamonas trahens ATCC 50062 TaxID=461836 RepID=A0A0L0DBQ1_THETB|nr:hypothetical protein AMSG_00503 [Thecamonas trahens ATCC 50062]KNC48728.1 hypothetical protein AMSG_00503 [Thecamonas trahens ATCC 50062]|eukprot:XP_013762780.1 hypothetical protein AMSG_00503 [Thecamonas trahens ATCC 50062]
MPEASPPRVTHRVDGGCGVLGENSSGKSSGSSAAAKGAAPEAAKPPPPPSGSAASGPSAATYMLVVGLSGLAGASGWVWSKAHGDDAFNDRLHREWPTIGAILGASNGAAADAALTKPLSTPLPPPFVAPEASAAIGSDQPAGTSPSAPTDAAASAPAADAAADAHKRKATRIAHQFDPPAKHAGKASKKKASKSHGSATAYDGRLETLLATPDDALSLEDRLHKQAEIIRREKEQIAALQTVIEQQALAQEERIRERVDDAIRRKEDIDAKAFDEVVRLQEQKHALELEEERARLATIHKLTLEQKEEKLRELAQQKAHLAAEKAAQDARLQELTAAWEEELAEQRVLLEKSYGREREDRLAKIATIEHKLTNVEKAASALAQFKSFSALVHTLSADTFGLTKVLLESQPFDDALDQLRRTALNGGESVIVLAIDAIPPALAREGIPTYKHLCDRFEEVRKRVRRVGLVPFNGGLGAHMLSYLHATLTFPKEGRVAGDDVDAVLARAHACLFAEDLPGAVAELESLPSAEWPARLVASWIAEARDRLLAEQSLQVVQSEVAAMAASLTE